MTTDELKELMARALLPEDFYIREAPPFRKEFVYNMAIKNAQAIIDALSPMMSGVAGGLRCIASDTTCELCTAYDVYPNGKYYLENEEVAKQALASLPDCWREKGGA